jgi:hypothetical protein
VQQLQSDVQNHAAGCAAPVLRDLAASGILRQAAGIPGECAWLRSAAFEVAMPLVWERHTRPLENRKGHRRCASGMIRLAPECHDGFTNDLESVVTALLSYGGPIANLEGWISARMSNAIKDGHRQRRAREMGAQQRVRVPARLAARLDGDPWLVALAGRVLLWAGVRHTAGTELWPLQAWAEERTAFTGPSAGDPRAAVACDLDVVLRAMRDSDPAWFEKYVERPLGRKWAPVPAGWPEDDGTARPEATCLQLVPGHERDEASLAEAAARSLTMIRAALASGADPRMAVVDALTVNFLSVVALRGELDRAPGSDTGDVVAAILNDRGALDRLVPVVLAIAG